ncbi:prepilin peptidase [Paenibacillus turpanensis]|uniref:prepilin peptidase n=1 Tax=Paenibacillus turpanensis TaxID=2689078 RepID=UPI00140C1C48|nr:A24 family peptidase [Paenibacillus turpanensis]
MVKLALLSCFLLAVLYTDLRSRRIPNKLCAAAFLAAIVYQGTVSSFAGLGEAAAGALAGGGLMVILYAAGATGGGDVKLFTAAGAWIGAAAAAKAVLIAVLISGAVAVIYFGWKGNLGSYFREIYRFLLCSAALRDPSIVLRDAALQKSRFPFAVAAVPAIYAALHFPFR